MIVDFILSAICSLKIRGLWKLPNGIDRLGVNLGPVLIYGAIFSKPLIQFTLDGCGCVQALLFELRPIYGMNNESNWDLLQKDLSKHSCIQCPSP